MAVFGDFKASRAQFFALFAVITFSIVWEEYE
jgi:hypothetical protein